MVVSKWELGHGNNCLLLTMFQTWVLPFAKSFSHLHSVKNNNNNNINDCHYLNNIVINSNSNIVTLAFWREPNWFAKSPCSADNDPFSFSSLSNRIDKIKSYIHSTQYTVHIHMYTLYTCTCTVHTLNQSINVHVHVSHTVMCMAYIYTYIYMYMYI